MREKLEASERAARQLADACYAAWGTINQGVAGAGRTANLIMDCSYVASATARLLAHSDEYQLHSVAMLVAVCRRVARRCAKACEEHPGSALALCARTASQTVAIFDDLIQFLWNTRDELAHSAPSASQPLEIVDPDESVA